MKKSAYKDPDSGSTKRFGYEWNKYSKIIPNYELQFLKWIYPLRKSDFNGKKVLDAGCGMGRNSYWPLKYGAKEVVAIDYDPRSVEAAKNNLSGFKNSSVRLESIYSLSYKSEFDIAFSIGVVHHLADPSLAVNNLVNSVKKGGKVLIWVYGYEGNEFIVKYINPVRKVTSKLPIWLTHKVSYLFSIPLYFYVTFSKTRNEYLKQLKSFNFWHTHSIVFDQLLPKIANYWKKEEVLALFQNNELKNISLTRVNENSWSIIGEKK